MREHNSRLFVFDLSFVGTILSSCKSESAGSNYSRILLKKIRSPSNQEPISMYDLEEFTEKLLDKVGVDRASEVMIATLRKNSKSLIMVTNSKC